jgi:hypothetical protein
MSDKEQIVSTITDIAKIALTVGSVSVSALGAMTLVPEYTYKILRSKGILKSKIDKELGKQVNPSYSISPGK